MDESMTQTAVSNAKKSTLSLKHQKSNFLNLLREQRGRRLIFKSPNPNDRQKILVGERELEADVLLNGGVFANGFKEHA